MYNFADTETSDPVNQRIVQLAAVLCDEQGQEVDVLNTLIKPDGWEICERFVGIHGITTDMCQQQGIPMVEALYKFTTFIKRSKKTICHNFKFDSARIDMELKLYGFHEDALILSQTPSFCTMVNLTNVCCIPNPNGRAGYKWPKLKEAHKHFFGIEFDKQHDALADVRACKRIYFEMHKPIVPVQVVESAPASSIVIEDSGPAL